MGETTGDRAGEKVGLESRAGARVVHFHSRHGLRGCLGDDESTVSNTGDDSVVGVSSSGVAGNGLDSAEGEPDASALGVTGRDEEEAVVGRIHLEGRRRRWGEEARLDARLDRPLGRLDRRTVGPTVAMRGATRGEGGGTCGRSRVMVVTGSVAVGSRVAIGGQ